MHAMRRVMMAQAAGGGGGGGGGSWSFAKTITIDRTKCGAADTTNYPLLFSATIPALKTVANGGSVVSASGSLPNDVAFFDASLSTMYDFEIESWDPVTGAIVAWVRVPTLSASVDTVLKLAYGNASISSPQQNVNGTWNANFKGVWHLGDGVNNYNTAMRADSTSNGFTLGNVPATGVAATGLVRGGLSMAGGSTHGLWTNAASGLLTAFTAEAWVNPSSFTNYRTLVCKGFGSTFNFALVTDIASGAGAGVPVILLTQGGVVKSVFDPTPLSTGVWTHLVGTWDGATMRLYRNGVSVGTPLAVTGSPDNIGSLNVGAQNQNANPMDGLLDEARVSDVARSASYVLATYNNIASPSTFYAVS